MKKPLVILAAAMMSAVMSYAQPLREHVLFDCDWKFALGDASSPAKDFGHGTEYFNYYTKAASIHNEGPYAPKYDASGWACVDLPHDWVVDLPYAEEASHSHGYKTVGYRYPHTSVGWYRKTFTIPEEDYGRHIWLQFDGIFRDARVWVNGFYLGHEPSGYASQDYDISEYLNYGSENVVCVRVDATFEEGWFYEGAGIYRHVWLNKASKLHVAPSGTFVHADFAVAYEQGGACPACVGLPALDFASVQVETSVRNMDAEGDSYSLKHILKDAEGKVVGEAGIQGRHVEAKDTHVSTAVIPLEKPHLWSCEDPYLYTLVTEVYASDGSLADVYETLTGIRHIAFDKDRGFILNGKSVKLKGANMHQDMAGVGSAIPDGLQEWRLRELKKIGVNAYRSSHNPMTPETLDACDRLGILVIEENRLTGVNDEHVRLLGRMIRRDRNHPSVILWSVGNEEWGLEWNDFGRRIAESMREYCHRFDPTRLMTVASSSGPDILVPADVAGYNYILQNPVEQHRKDYPDRIALGSEETTGCGTRGIYFDRPGTKPSAADAGNGRMVALNRAKHGPDSLYNCIERGWKFYDERPWLAGVFYWTGFDYRGEPNPMVFPATSSEFGILDYCGFPKDEAYYLKSWWTSEPVLHILPHWNLQGHEGEEVSVWVYGNCDEVELIANGKKLGRRKMPRNGHLEWTAVYKPGYVKAVGYKGGRKVMEKRLDTTGEASAAAVSCEELGDVAVVTVEMRDARGRFVPTSCDDLEITVGEGWTILGWGNGDPAFQYVERPVKYGPSAATAADPSLPVSECGTPVPDRDAMSMRITAFNGLARVFLQRGTGDAPASAAAVIATR